MELLAPSSPLTGAPLSGLRHGQNQSNLPLSHWNKSLFSLVYNFIAYQIQACKKPDLHKLSERMSDMEAACPRR